VSAFAQVDVGISHTRVHVWQLVGVAFVPGHGAPTEYECALGCGSVMYRAAGEPFPPTNWSRHPAPVERHGRSQT